MKHTSQKIVLFGVALGIIAGMALGVWELKTRQQLGLPGIMGSAIPGKVKMAIGLPPVVLDYVSTNVPEDKIVTETLPHDTSFAQRRYFAPDGFWVNAGIVLMGMDRTSIHKPEFCLPGQGWNIVRKTTVDIPIAGERPYKLKVSKWVISNSFQTTDGKKFDVSGLYVFWFVAHNEQTASHWQRLWWLTRDMLRTGELQRWAYVSWFTVCEPGKEDATFARMKALISAAVPEFQLPPEMAK